MYDSWYSKIILIEVQEGAEEVGLREPDGKHVRIMFDSIVSIKKRVSESLHVNVACLLRIPVLLSSVFCQSRLWA